MNTRSLNHILSTEINDVEFGARMAAHCSIEALTGLGGFGAFSDILETAWRPLDWKKFEHFVVLEHMITLLQKDVDECDATQDTKRFAHAWMFKFIDSVSPFM